MTPWLLPLTIPASWAYRAAVASRNRRFDAGRGVERLDRPVISVGNLTVGGTGKTPHVMWIAQSLIDAGHRPVIAMRGYKAPPGQPGDEEQEYLDRFGAAVPVIAHPRRVEALRAFLARPENARYDAVILDDGFQHRRLARDLDLVLIDATQQTFADRLLPAGRLREPLGTLKRADAVIVTRAGQVDAALARQVEQHHGRPPLAWSNHIWSGLTLHGADPASAPLEWLRGKRLITMFGVGNPQPLRLLAREHGATILSDIPVADHQVYHAATIGRVRPMLAGADGLLVSPKDWVKLRAVIRPGTLPVPIVVPDLRLTVLTGEDPLRKTILRTANRRPTITTERSAPPASNTPEHCSFRCPAAGAHRYERIPLICS